MKRKLLSLTLYSLLALSGFCSESIASAPSDADIRNDELFKQTKAICQEVCQTLKKDLARWAEINPTGLDPTPICLRLRDENRLQELQEHLTLPDKIKPNALTFARSLADLSKKFPRVDQKHIAVLLGRQDDWANPDFQRFIKYCELMGKLSNLIDNLIDNH
jgi:hypothetical protein